MIVKLIPTSTTPCHVHNGNCTQGRSNWFENYSHCQVVGIISALITHNVLLWKVDIIVCQVVAIQTMVPLWSLFVFGDPQALTIIFKVCVNISTSAVAKTSIDLGWIHTAAMLAIRSCVSPSNLLCIPTAACDWDCLLFFHFFSSDAAQMTIMTLALMLTKIISVAYRYAQNVLTMWHKANLWMYHLGIALNHISIFPRKTCYCWLQQRQKNMDALFLWWFSVIDRLIRL